MMAANTSGWQEWVSVPGRTLELLSGLSHSGINNARTGLLDRNRIEYRPSDNRKKASKYKIIPFIQELPQKKNECENELPTESENESENESASIQRTSERTLSKLNVNKTKQKDIIMTPDEHAFLTELEQIENYPLDREKDISMYKLLSERYPDIDLLGALKDWRINKISNPLKPSQNPRSQLNTWCGNAQKWGKNKKNKVVSIDAKSREYIG